MGTASYRKTKVEAHRIQPQNMFGIKIAFVMAVAMVAISRAEEGPKCVDQQENCAHFVEEKPEWSTLFWPKSVLKPAAIARVNALMLGIGARTGKTRDGANPLLDT